MKKSMKAALWSALVFPGVGHFVLKRYARGLLLLVPTIVAFGFILTYVVQKASTLAEKIVSGTVPADAATIEALVSGSADGSTMTDIAGYVILACWVVGIVDSYRIGSTQDKG
jgi:hypothetical protein